MHATMPADVGASAETATAVIADLEAWLPLVARDAALRETLERALRAHDLRRPPLRIASLAFGALTGREAPIRLTSLVALIHVGAGLHDDVSDGDLAGGSKAEALALLASGTCLASLAPQALATLVSGRDVLPALGLLWRGMEAMASGQRRDLALFGEPEPDPKAAEAALLKTTAECGLYAALGARVAGASSDALPRWEKLGAEIGYALQLLSDCNDALDPAGRDIGAGARTLPIAFALRAGSDGDRAQLRRTLGDAAHDPQAAARVRDAIVRSGSLVACTTLVEAAIVRARRLLAALGLERDAALNEFLSELSCLRQAS